MVREGSRIRVCFAVDASQEGGAEKYVSGIARGLDKRVFETVVLARNGPGLDRWCGGLVSAGVSVIRVPMELPFHPSHALPLWKALRRIEPRIVHVNVPGPYDGQMGLTAPFSRLAGAGGVVVTEHLPRVERLWKRALVKSLSYQWVDRVLTVCRASVPYLIGRQRVPEFKVGVVYNGVPASYGSDRLRVRDGARRNLGLEGEARGIAFVASLVERKGLGVLIDALSGLARGDWRLLVAGTGEREGHYRRLCAERGLGDRVRFLGGLADREVEQLLCAADVLALPSFIEGMPYVILEAMACALPVISTTVDGIPEAAPDGEAALLVPPGDAAALGAAVERLLDDGRLRGDMGQNGRKRFERFFTLDRHIAEMETVYADLVSGPRRKGTRES